MKMKVMAMTCALLGALGSSTAGLASTFTYNVVLNGAGENPVNGSTATGSATISLNDVTNQLSVSLTFSGLTGGNASAAHIHCCAAYGSNGPVQLPFTGFPSAASGAYSNIFNLNTTTFAGGLTEAGFITGLESGLAYINIHNATYPGGEIRAQIVNPVPEPGSLALLGTGLLGFVGMVRRKIRG